MTDYEVIFWLLPLADYVIKAPSKAAAIEIAEEIGYTRTPSITGQSTFVHGTKILSSSGAGKDKTFKVRVFIDEPAVITVSAANGWQAIKKARDVIKKEWSRVKKEHKNEEVTIIFAPDDDKFVDLSEVLKCENHPGERQDPATERENKKHPPKGTLLEDWGRGDLRIYVFADGNGGTYQEAVGQLPTPIKRVGL